MRAILTAALVVVASGCAKEREPAPTEMVDLVRYLFDGFEDPDLVADGMVNLTAWMEDNVHTDVADEGCRLDPLTQQDTRSVEHPNRSFDALLGAAGGAVSGHPIGDHAEHILIRDQTFANPGQYEAYARSFEGGRGDFEQGSGVLRTSNEVITKSFGIKIPYTLYKDYRWVPSEDGPDHILARSWVADRSCNDKGSSCLELSFSLDVFQAVPGGCNRLTATWSEATSIVDVPEKLMIAGLAQGLQNVFDNTEEFLDEGGVD